MEEFLPPRAWALEELCRETVDLYRSWGYELVIPPLLEYLESLLTGSAQDLDLRTFKVMDQLNGRMMGIRADITPQIARIDARVLKRDVPARLCYLGTVLHTRADIAATSRSPLQTGAELFGHRGIGSDIEILRLMIETLRLAGACDVNIDIGHVGIYRTLAQACELDAEQESGLSAALQQRALPELSRMLDDWQLPDTFRDALNLLPELHGDSSVLDRIRKRLLGTVPQLAEHVAELEQLNAALQTIGRDISWQYDLGELRGYHYHTGLLFTAYCSGGCSDGVAFGGRYDDTGACFGRARPATGFSLDLKQLLTLREQGGSDRRPIPARVILAPAEKDEGLEEQICRLRNQGEVVIVALQDDSSDATALGCNHMLSKNAGNWEVIAVPAE